jgi:hypothetical protein
MLSRDASPETRALLPMPNRPVTDLMIALSGVDAWTAGLGAPLELRKHTAGAEELVEANRRLHDGSDRGDWLAQRVVAALAEYRLLALLLRSRAGRRVLSAGRLQAYAAWRIGEARRWVAWTCRSVDGTAPGALAMLLIAQAWFVASRGAGGGLVPSEELLAELLANEELDDAA